jgi:poly-gamma-glutamate synthesis protein (capsule biosynthesis protein)
MKNEINQRMTENPVNILIAGDLCPINRIESLAKEGDYQKVFNDFFSVLRGNDLNIVDLECPLTVSESARKKIGPHQKAHPDCISILKYADIGLAALANNHIMDYGTGGITETLEVCESNNIPVVGVGKSISEASRPYVTAISGRKIAVLNCADDEFVTTSDRAYTCNAIDPVRLYYDIRETKAVADFLIVIVHAGNEYYSLPSPRTRALYRYLVDCGADAVVANHAHAFSGYEVYKSKPVFYGLGNFIYDWPGHPEASWYRGYVVRLTISDAIDFEIIPLRQGGDEPGIFKLTDAETRSFHDEIERLNSIIADDSRLEAEFRSFCDSVSPMYDSFVEPYFGRFITALRSRGFLPKLMSKRKRLLLLNIIRCESHREVLTAMLGKNG